MSRKKKEEQLQSSLPPVEEVEETREVVSHYQNPPAPPIDLAELVATIRGQILEELRASGVTIPDPEEAKKRKEKERRTYGEYVAMMKNSPIGWVDLRGISDNIEGVRIELDWNDAFVTELREAGITGSDDEQVVQKWIALLSRDIDDSNAPEVIKKSEYE